MTAAIHKLDTFIASHACTSDADRVRVASTRAHDQSVPRGASSRRSPAALIRRWPDHRRASGRAAGMRGAAPLSLTLFDGTSGAGWSWPQGDEPRARRILAHPAAPAGTPVAPGNAHTPPPAPDWDAAWAGASVITIEVRDGELIAALTKQVAERDITNGVIVSLIGAVDTFTLSTMPADDVTNDVPTEYDLPAETSGTGEIVDGAVHIHAVMAVEGNRALSEHLHFHKVRIGTWLSRLMCCLTPRYISHRSRNH
jgi:predicted DNA-binding protein with PD1-like motif